MPRTGAILFGAIVLTATFGSGVVVGRHWARQPLVLASDASTKAAAPGPRRSGLVDAETERPRGVDDRLTFYRTLTAPLGPAPATAPVPGKPHVEARPRASEERPAASRETPRSEARPRAVEDRAVTSREGPRHEVHTPAIAPAAVPASRGPAPGGLVAAAAVADAPGSGSPGRAVKASLSSSSPVAATPGEPAPTWAVQVGVFKGRQQAETAHRKLVEGGLQASVTPAMVDGETRYRVRAGSYRTRAEAERVAERVRHDRALPTYITLN